MKGPLLFTWDLVTATAGLRSVFIDETLKDTFDLDLVKSRASP